MKFFNLFKKKTFDLSKLDVFSDDKILKIIERNVYDEMKGLINQYKYLLHEFKSFKGNTEEDFNKLFNYDLINKEIYHKLLKWDKTHIQENVKNFILSIEKTKKKVKESKNPMGITMVLRFDVKEMNINEAYEMGLKLLEEKGYVLNYEPLREAIITRITNCK